MEDMLTIRFEKKELEIDNNSLSQYLFKGIRCSEDVAWKISFLCGQLLGLNDVVVEVEDEDSVGLSRLDMSELKDVDLSLIEISEGYDDEDQSDVKDDNVDS